MRFGLMKPATLKPNYGKLFEYQISQPVYYSEDNSTYDFIGPSVSINKQYGLVEITISDTNYLGKYEINISPTNMHNASAFGLQKKTETLYYEPKTPGKYYLHVTDQFNNLSE